jgi:hypothetical protein
MHGETVKFQRLCTILSSVVSPALPYFSTLSHNRHDFRKKKVIDRKVYLISSTNFVWNISHSTSPLFLQHFNETWIFSADFRKNAQISNFMKIRPMEAELFHADGRTERRTDMTKLIVIVRSFANAAKNITQTGFCENIVSSGSTEWQY